MASYTRDFVCAQVFNMYVITECHASGGFVEDKIVQGAISHGYVKA